MKAIEGYWSQIGGANMLPGTVRSADRFVRGSYFQSHVMATNDADLGLAIIRSIMFNVSVPFHYEVAGEPNLSSTQWRSFANIRDRRYYFDMTTAMGIYYIDLKRCDLSAGAPVMMLDTSKALKTTGDATGSLKPPTRRSCRCIDHRGGVRTRSSGQN